MNTSPYLIPFQMIIKRETFCTDIEKVAAFFVFFTLLTTGFEVEMRFLIHAVRHYN